MRFLADMGIAFRIVDWLRAQGYEITHLREENLQCLPDADIFRKCDTEDRVLLTFDLDFGEIVALSQERKVSIVLFRLRNTGTPHVIERLRAARQATEEILKSGALVVVEESRLRVRRLPLLK